MKTKRCKLIALPYPVVLELILCDDIAEEGSKMEDMPPLQACAGAVVFSNAWFALFLSTAELSHSLIAHECFHATHFILHHCGVRFKVSDHHEAHAFFNGYLNSQVIKQLKKWNIKIK